MPLGQQRHPEREPVREQDILSARQRCLGEVGRGPWAVWPERGDRYKTQRLVAKVWFPNATCKKISV